MYYPSLAAFALWVASVQAHGVILKAVGDSGFSQGFLVNNTLARNCTDISPCQLDATIIRDEEIANNVVNGCGRTELAGNIDIGEQTEEELAKGRVTTVKQGTTMKITIHQVNADGAGPYACDLDETSNANTNFRKLKVTNNVPGVNGLSRNKIENFVINVELPTKMNCIGGSTGNICTVRCRNNALAGPFGGCFAVQQTDGAGRVNSSAANVDTNISLKEVDDQIQVNKQQLADAIAANQQAGATNGNSGAAAVSALLPDVSANASTNGKHVKRQIRHRYFAA